METFRVECSKCGEIVETTARTFPWPYVCGECETAKKFQQGLASNVNAAVNKVMSGALWDTNGKAKEGGFDAPSHDSATVENTTLLIEDLEAQVAASAKALDTANDLINDLTKQSKKESANFKEIQLDLLLALNRETHRANTNDERRRGLLKIWATAAQEAKYWERMCKSARQRAKEVSEDLYAITSRGFFARVFNY